MSLGVAILALAFLVFVHEAGHFVVARAVGMTPRKFYLGFGPPLVKRMRGGVEYGIAALPLGGYVKIPGMHRPAAGDLRQSLASAQQDELAPQLAALDAALERDDEATALAVATQLEPQLPGNKQLQELEWALAPDAYWRQRVWKKVVVIAAGPLTNVALAVVLLVIFFMMGAFKASQIVGLCCQAIPQRQQACTQVTASCPSPATPSPRRQWASRSTPRMADRSHSSLRVGTTA